MKVTQALYQCLRLRRQNDGADTVEVACELLDGGECDGGEGVNASVWYGVV
jgi:hypothetical protein